MPARDKTIKNKSTKEIHDHVETLLQNVRKQPGVVSWYGKKRHCWLYETKAKVPQIFSSDPYAVFYRWWVYKKENHLPPDQQVKTNLLKQVRRAKQGQGEQQSIRHRCANRNCCNPKHLKLGSPTDKETDKHYHHFLHNNSIDKKQFVESMPQQDKRLFVRGERLW
jgi:hypothetical protein